MIVSFLLLVLLGLAVGALGTLIGAGGGFILVPALLLLYPQESPDLITSTSLAVVFANALSGSLAYARMRRIDYRSGLLFAAATIPGAILGALNTSFIPRRIFNGIFGLLLVALALFLLRRMQRLHHALTPKPASGNWTRSITEKSGQQHNYSYNPKLGFGLSLGVGYLSSLLGIGGGIIHVPALVQLLNFPVHIATATSQFILMIMAAAGVGVHVLSGVLASNPLRVLALTLGVVVGAQLGAHFSTRARNTLILRVLAFALAFIGTYIFITALT